MSTTALFIVLALIQLSSCNVQIAYYGGSTNCSTFALKILLVDNKCTNFFNGSMIGNCTADGSELCFNGCEGKDCTGSCTSICGPQDWFSCFTDSTKSLSMKCVKSAVPDEMRGLPLVARHATENKKTMPPHFFSSLLRMVKSLGKKVAH